MKYDTKDSGQRAEFSSGMVRDTEVGKARFDLLFPRGIPYKEQMLTRFAELMTRGADKYEERNWEKARGEAELQRYYSSATRHLMQWITGEDDEDHAAAVMFNILAAETLLARQPSTLSCCGYHLEMCKEADDRIGSEEVTRVYCNCSTCRLHAARPRDDYDPLD